MASGTQEIHPAPAKIQQRMPRPTDRLKSWSTTRQVVVAGWITAHDSACTYVRSPDGQVTQSFPFFFFPLFLSQNFIAFCEEINSGSTACQHRLCPGGTEEDRVSVWIRRGVCVCVCVCLVLSEWQVSAGGENNWGKWEEEEEAWCSSTGGMRGRCWDPADDREGAK